MIENAQAGRQRNSAPENGLGSGIAEEFRGSVGVVLSSLKAFMIIDNLISILDLGTGSHYARGAA
jgi:hypothetical protein